MQVPTMTRSATVPGPHLLQLARAAGLVRIVECHNRRYHQTPNVARIYGASTDVVRTLMGAGSSPMAVGSATISKSGPPALLQQHGDVIQPDGGLSPSDIWDEGQGTKAPCTVRSVGSLARMAQFSGVEKGKDGKKDGTVKEMKDGKENEQDRYEQP